MASKDPIQAYIDLPIADRWAVDRLMAPSDRATLHQRVRARLYAEQRQKRRAENPAALLKCHPALAKHLVSVAVHSTTPEVTAKTRIAVRAAIEHFTGAP